MMNVPSHTKHGKHKPIIDGSRQMRGHQSLNGFVTANCVTTRNVVDCYV